VASRTPATFGRIRFCPEQNRAAWPSAKVLLVADLPPADNAASGARAVEDEDIQ
jgi:hypothetical protein